MNNNEINPRQVLVDLATEHVVDRFDLGEEFQVTNFKSKGPTITLTSPDYEVTVALKGQPAEDVYISYMNTIEALKAEKEAEQYAEEEAEEVEEVEEVEEETTEAPENKKKKPLGLKKK